MSDSKVSTFRKIVFPYNNIEFTYLKPLASFAKAAHALIAIYLLLDVFMKMAVFGVVTVTQWFGYTLHDSIPTFSYQVVNTAVNAIVLSIYLVIPLAIISVVKLVNNGLKSTT